MEDKTTRTKRSRVDFEDEDYEIEPSINNKRLDIDDDDDDGDDDIGQVKGLSSSSGNKSTVETDMFGDDEEEEITTATTSSVRLNRLQPQTNSDQREEDDDDDDNNDNDDNNDDNDNDDDDDDEDDYEDDYEVGQQNKDKNKGKNKNKKNKKKSYLLEDDGGEDMSAELSIGSTETKFTPFNLNDEMKEGRYDESGNYFENKRDKDEVADAWADSIDWQELAAKEQLKKAKSKKNTNKSENDAGESGATGEMNVDDVVDDEDSEIDPLEAAMQKKQNKKAKSKSKSKKKNGKDEEGDDNDDDNNDDEDNSDSDNDNDNDNGEQQDGSADPNFNATQMLFKLQSYLQSGESVAQAVRRLGNKSAGIGANKKSNNKYSNKTVATSAEEKAKLAENKKALMELIEIADVLVQNGYTNVYDDTIESINHQLSFGHAPDFGGSSISTENVDVTNEPSKVYDNSSTADNNSNNETSDNSNNGNSSGEANEVTQELDENQVYWQYKWQESPDAEIYGPFSTAQLMAWKDSGYFDGQSVFVRKYSSSNDGQFYKIERIDFDLYT